ncbi:MAG: MBOAT family O-acyltransferase, partial [Pyrinomonadaceae bacterium]
MLFNSFAFFVFLPLVLFLYWSASVGEMRQWILLIASLAFYGFWYPPHLMLFLGLTSVCWFTALYCAK